MEAERQQERRVATWLAIVRGVLAQLAKQQRDNDRIYKMKEDEVWELTLRLERMKRDGTWGRSTSTGEAQPDNGVVVEVAGRVGAISISPEEIWRKIMNELSDPTDLWNCNSTCQLFEKVLRPWKSARLMRHALPYIYHQLTKEEILECRQVCKSWRDEVDNFLQNHPSLRPYQEEEGYYKRLDFVCPLKEKTFSEDNSFIFCNDPQRDNSAILEEERFKKYPFIGRFVSVRLGNQKLFNRPKHDEPEDPWWERSYQFLNTFGRSIWYLTLTFPNKPSKLIQTKLITFVETLMFQSMPNLRKLTIDANGCRFNDALLSADVLPEAPQLETLELMSLDLVGSRFNKLFHPLVTKYAANQLRKLRISGINFVRVRGMNFENLKELIIDVGGARTSTVFFQLNAFSDYRMEKLTKIHLIFPLHHAEYLFEDLADFINIMTAITQLSSLRLAGNTHSIRFGSDQELAARSLGNPRYNCNPSSLHTIEVDMCYISFVTGPRPMCFNFMFRYFPQLVNLSIFVRETVPEFHSLNYDSGLEVDMLNDQAWNIRATLNYTRSLELDEVVELHRYMFRGDMYESRVWELMEQLKVLTVQWKVFTREGYEERRQQEKV